MIEGIGFMQGRLSPLGQGKIQAFPVDHWRDEMVLASRNNFACMEWTLEYKDFHLNPIMTRSGQLSISQLQKQTDLNVISLTGDLFMQEPFWHNVGKKREKLIDCFMMVCDQCASAKVPFLVLPLVDNGRLRDEGEERVEPVHTRAVLLAEAGVLAGCADDGATRNRLAEVRVERAFRGALYPLELA